MNNTVGITSYDDFLHEIASYMYKLNSCLMIQISDVVKNNETVLKGFVIREPGNDVAPSFYLKNEYNDFLKGEKLSEIAQRVYLAYLEERKKFDEEKFEISFKWEDIKDRITFRLINTEKNENSLKNLPNYQFYDLSIVFIQSVRIGDSSLGTIAITNEYLERLGISKECLYETAILNTRKQQLFEISDICDTLVRLYQKNGHTHNDITEILAETKRAFMYVLSTNGPFGATAMVYEDILKNFAEKVEDSFYILPSSIHELILIPKKNVTKVEFLASIVYEINRTQLEREEVLSDSVYYYDRDKERITMVTENINEKYRKIF